MSLPLQHDSLGALRYSSDVCWRDSASNLSDGVIAGALRTAECQVDAFARLLGDGAVQDLERSIYMGLQLQVRLMRLDRFPVGCLPIRLDWRSAWQPSDWETFAASEDADDIAKETKIVECFGDDSPPLSVTYGSCDQERITLDPTQLKLLSSQSGDQVLLADGCYWPCIDSCGCSNNYVEIKYLVGFVSDQQIRDQHPLVLSNLAAMFNYRFENPETMAGQGHKTYELLTRYFQRNLAWR